VTSTERTTTVFEQHAEHPDRQRRLDASRGEAGLVANTNQRTHEPLHATQRVATQTRRWIRNQYSSARSLPQLKHQIPGLPCHLAARWLADRAQDVQSAGYPNDRIPKTDITAGGRSVETRHLDGDEPLPRYPAYESDVDRLRHHSHSLLVSPCRHRYHH
jgi:hypothetical protein